MSMYRRVPHLLPGQVFASNEIADVVEEIIYALAHLLKDHRQFLLVCDRLKGFQLWYVFDQLRQRQINVWVRDLLRRNCCGAEQRHNKKIQT